MQDPVYDKIQNTPRPSLTATSALVFLAAIGLWLAELALSLLPVAPAQESVAANAAYYLPFVVLPMAVYMLRRPGLGDGMRLNPPPLSSMLSVGLLAILSVYVASLFSALWGLALDGLGLRTLNGYAAPRSERAVLLSILALAAMPAVCEELLFRGLVLSAWEGRGTWFAVGVSAALFALLHGNLYGLPAYLLVGAVSGFLTFALDSVYAGMIYHTVYNAACLVIPYLQADAAQEEAAVTGRLLLSASANGLMLMAMMAMLMASLWLRARRLGLMPIPRVRRPLSAAEKLTLLAAVAAMLVTLAAVQLIAARMAGNGGMA